MNSKIAISEEYLPYLLILLCVIIFTGGFKFYKHFTHRLKYEDDTKLDKNLTRIDIIKSIQAMVISGLVIIAIILRLLF